MSSMLQELMAFTRSQLRTAALAYVGAAALALGCLIIGLLMTPAGQIVQEAIRAPLAPIIGVPNIVARPVATPLPDAPLSPSPLLAILPPPPEPASEEPSIGVVTETEISEQVDEEPLDVEAPSTDGDALAEVDETAVQDPVAPTLSVESPPAPLPIAVAETAGVPNVLPPDLPPATSEPSVESIPSEEPSAAGPVPLVRVRIPSVPPIDIALIPPLGSNEATMPLPAAPRMENSPPAPVPALELPPEEQPLDPATEGAPPPVPPMPPAPVRSSDIPAAGAGGGSSVGNLDAAPTVVAVATLTPVQGVVPHPTVTATGMSPTIETVLSAVATPLPSVTTAGLPTVILPGVLTSAPTVTLPNLPVATVAVPPSPMLTFQTLPTAQVTTVSVPTVVVPALTLPSLPAVGAIVQPTVQSFPTLPVPTLTLPSPPILPRLLP